MFLRMLLLLSKIDADQATRQRGSAFPRRDAPELWLNLSPRNGGRGRYPKGGAGNAGCPLHPQPRV
jgi:hypothetical protein